MKKKFTTASVELTALKHETIIRNGKKGIFIPIDDNPCIFFQEKQNPQTGRSEKIITIDIDCIPTPNGKFGSTHLLKGSLSKKTRERLGITTNEQADQYRPILGNIKEKEFEVADAPGQQQGGYAPQQGQPYPPQGQPYPPQGGYAPQGGTYVPQQPGGTPHEFDPGW